MWCFGAIGLDGHLRTVHSDVLDLDCCPDFVLFKREVENVGTTEIQF